MERLLGFERAREWIFARVPKGRVLEVGAGTGRNIAHYPAGPVIVTSDLSAAMLARAAEKAAHGGLTGRLVVTDAEDLAFRDQAFDAVVATCVFCSVPDPLRGLSEVRRILKDGGAVFLLEHMRPRGWLGRLFDLVDPIASRLMGPHLNRRTLDTVREAGLVVVEERRVFSDWIKLIVAR
jgi:ubiquinone/menaquinone biosynthesis C-methylase UbiE